MNSSPLWLKIQPILQKVVQETALLIGLQQATIWGGGEQNFVRTQDGRNSLLVIGAGRLNLYMNQVNADLKGDIDPNPS